MVEATLMSRVAVLEANERHTQNALKEMADSSKSMAANVQDIRDAVLASNLIELPKRVTALEKNRWIGHGISAGIGGSAGIGVMKFLSMLGMVIR